MAKFHPIRELKKAFRHLYGSAMGKAKSFSQKTDDALTETPIDFSAPSIPYYENLADRLSFVRIILYMVLVVFVTVTMVSNHRLITYENLYYLAKDIGAATLTAQSMADQISYPISAADAEFALFRGGVANAFFKELKEKDAFVAAPKWLDRDKNTLQGKVIAMPTKADIDFDIAVHLIVELYSK